MINNKPSPIAFYRPLTNRLPEFILHITVQTANQFLALNAYLANSINSSQNRLSLRSSSPEATPPEIKSSLKLFSFSESFFNYVICKAFYLYNLTFLLYVSSAYIFISKIKMSNTRGQIISFHCLCSTVA